MISKHIKTRKDRSAILSSVVIIFLLMLTMFSSCKKYLEIKSDKKLTVPESLDDCEALLSSSSVMNWGYPSQGEASSDNFYLTSEAWNASSVIERNNYIWKADADVNPGIWGTNYTRVLNANQVLETLNKITPTAVEQTRWNIIKGRALFFRAFSFFNIAQIWAKPYDKSTANQDLGIPIRLTPNLTEITERGTVQQTYDRILQDLREAQDLLPAIQPVSILNKTVQPVKAAAMAALARIYLSMGDYTSAGVSANDCLLQYNALIDYNSLNPNAPFPISRLNPEVIFQAQGGFFSMFNQALIDPELYRSYQTNDLRQIVLFQSKGNDTYGFKGSYNGTVNATPFVGIATDEIYLIRAECYARSGSFTAAMNDLNTLLRTRWANSLTAGPYINKTATNGDEALAQILLERRKELLFRGLRWTDLRRLNKENRFAVSLSRVVGNQIYTLPANDLRYVLLIPQDILKNTNIPQNPR